MQLVRMLVLLYNTEYIHRIAQEDALYFVICTFQIHTMYCVSGRGTRERVHKSFLIHGRKSWKLG